MVKRNHKPSDALLDAINGDSGHQPRYEPSPEEIARLTAEIRDEWDTDTYARRNCTVNHEFNIEHKIHIDVSGWIDV